MLIDFHEPDELLHYNNVTQLQMSEKEEHAQDFQEIPWAP